MPRPENWNDRSTICIFLSDRRVSIVLELFFFSRSYRFYKTVRIAWKYYYSDIFNSLFLQKFLYQRSLIIRNFYCQVYHSWNWTLNRFRNSLQRLERLALNSLKNLILSNVLIPNIPCVYTSSEQTWIFHLQNVPGRFDIEITIHAKFEKTKESKELELQFRWKFWIALACVINRRSKKGVERNFSFVSWAKRDRRVERERDGRKI